MEEGSLRCDANVSVRPRGATALGTRAEIKNLNSFRHVARAIEHEVTRQVALVESGRQVTQETRLWNETRGETAPMRSKEDAHDYRYFPEPDLRPLAVSSEWLAEVRASLPELPADKRRRFVSEYALPDYDAGVLTQERELADYFEAAARESGQPEGGLELDHDRAPAQAEGGRTAAGGGARRAIRAGRARQAGRRRHDQRQDRQGRVRADVDERRPAAAIVEREGLGQLDDGAALQPRWPRWLRRAPSRWRATAAARPAALGWFVGQVMKKTGGRANPQTVNELLRKALDDGERCRIVEG